MKTAEEILKEVWTKKGLTKDYQKMLLRSCQDSLGTYLFKAMQEYAREAIKADRENVAKHATATLYRSENDERLDDAIVDKDSIINAPKIELL